MKKLSLNKCVHVQKEDHFNFSLHVFCILKSNMTLLHSFIMQ